MKQSPCNHSQTDRNTGRAVPPILHRCSPALLAILLAGCMTAPPAPAPTPDAEPEPDPTAETVQTLMDEAHRLYMAGQLDEALKKCVVIEQFSNQDFTYLRLRKDIESAILELRAEEARVQEELAMTSLTVEATEAFALPDTYGLERVEDADIPLSHQVLDSPIQQVLNTPVTMHLKGAQLSTIIQVLSEAENLNIISDQGLAAGKAVDIEVEEVPLQEILDYVARNFNVQFYLGKNVIWATPPAAQGGGPLETRIYYLRKGIQAHAVDWGRPEKPEPQYQDMSAVSFRATVLAEGKSYIEEVIELFVPQTETSQLHLDRNTHALLVRNTPENLALVEQILDALDIDPPQVFIEARFIEVGVADLRELGIEWILDTPWVVTEKMVDGVAAPRSIIQQGDVVNFPPYLNDAAGPFPFNSPGGIGNGQGGTVPTGQQGLNLTYQGILTEPMFQAVLHALDISGKGKTLSVPRVTTVNNNPAKLRHGEDLLYYEEFQAQAFNLVDANNKRYTVTALTPKDKPTKSELGITLVAVPSVGADKSSISLLLTPTISRLEGFVSYQDDGPEDADPADYIEQVVVKLPIIARREIQTKVVVQSGETVVMGGLIDTISEETEHKVPFIGDLPLIGPLFRRMEVTEQNRNLLIFVTATVLSSRGESVVPSRLENPTRPLDALSPVRRTEPDRSPVPAPRPVVTPTPPPVTEAALPTPAPAPVVPEPLPVPAAPVPAEPVPAVPDPIPAPAEPVPVIPAPAPAPAPVPVTPAPAPAPAPVPVTPAPVPAPAPVPVEPAPAVPEPAPAPAEPIPVTPAPIPTPAPVPITPPEPSPDDPVQP